MLFSEKKLFLVHFHAKVISTTLVYLKMLHIKIIRTKQKKRIKLNIHIILS